MRKSCNAWPKNFNAKRKQNAKRNAAWKIECKEWKRSQAAAAAAVAAAEGLGQQPGEKEEDAEEPDIEPIGMQEEEEEEEQESERTDMQKEVEEEDLDDLTKMLKDPMVPSFESTFEDALEQLVWPKSG